MSKAALNKHTSFVPCRSFDISKNKSQIPGKFRNVNLETNGDHLNRWCEKLSNVQSQIEEEYPTYNKKTGLVTYCVVTAI